MLVTAIVERGIADYVNSLNRVKYLTVRRQKRIESGIRPIKKGETKRQYRQYKYQHSVRNIDRQIKDANIIVDECREFLLGDWLKSISSLDGEAILTELNRKYIQKDEEKSWD